MVVLFIFFIFIPNFGEDEPILTNMFQRGWFNHQLVFVEGSKNDQTKQQIYGEFLKDFPEKTGASSLESWLTSLRVSVFGRRYVQRAKPGGPGTGGLFLTPTGG